MVVCMLESFIMRSCVQGQLSEIIFLLFFSDLVLKSKTRHVIAPIITKIRCVTSLFVFCLQE